MPNYNFASLPFVRTHGHIKIVTEPPKKITITKSRTIQSRVDEPRIDLCLKTQLLYMNLLLSAFKERIETHKNHFVSSRDLSVLKNQSDEETLLVSILSSRSPMFEATYLGGVPAFNDRQPFPNANWDNFYKNNDVFRFTSKSKTIATAMVTSSKPKNNEFTVTVTVFFDDGITNIEHFFL